MMNKKFIRAKTSLSEGPSIFHGYVATKSKYQLLSKTNKIIVEILSKLGIIRPYYSQSEIKVFNFDEHKYESFRSEFIYALNSDLDLGRNIDDRNYVVVVGSDTFFDALCEKDSDRYITSEFTFDIGVDYVNPYHGKKIMNFKCHVVPGMQGFAIVPKVIIEERRIVNNETH